MAPEVCQRRCSGATGAARSSARARASATARPAGPEAGKHHEGYAGGARVRCQVPHALAGPVWASVGGRAPFGGLP
eukprot:5218529-Alexandrium_andersonii.AAC.1